MINKLANGDFAISNTNGELFIYDSTLNNLKTKFDNDFNIYAMLTESDGKTWKGSRRNGIFDDGDHYK